MKRSPAFILALLLLFAAAGVAGPTAGGARTVESPECTVDIVRGKNADNGLVKVFYADPSNEKSTYIVLVASDAYWDDGVHPQEWGQDLDEQHALSGTDAQDAMNNAKEWAKNRLKGADCIAAGLRELDAETLTQSDWQTEGL